MKLNSIVLHNYRKFQHEEISFPDGIMAIIGNNGSGKSTIIEAIGWAIYGNKVTSSRTNKEGIRRQGAEPNEECWVKLSFELGGDVYEVTRIMSPSFSADANVKVNGLVAASSASGATLMLEKKIGMDYDAFFTSLVARQKEINALSSKTAGERKKSMLKMLKIDAIEDAVRMVREDKRRKESVVDALSGALKDIDMLEKEMADVEKKREETVSTLKEMEGKILLLEEEAKKLEAERGKERKKMERYNELEKEAGLVGERIKSKQSQMAEKEGLKNKLEEKKARYGQIKPLEDEYARVKKEKERMESLREKYLLMKQMNDSISALQEEIGELDKVISSLEDRLREKGKLESMGKELEARQKEIADEIRKIESSIKIKQFQIKASNEKMEEAERERKKIEESGPDSGCPTCGRPLKDMYGSILESFEKKVAAEKERVEGLAAEEHSLEEQIGRLKVEEGAVSKKMDETKKLMDEINVLERKMNHAVESRKEKAEKIAEVKSKIEQMGTVSFDESEYNECRKRFEELTPVKEEIIILRNEIGRLPDIESSILQLKQDIETLEARRKSIAGEIEQLGFDRERYEVIEGKYEKKREEVQKMREERVRLEGEASRAAEEAERLRRDIKEQKEAREKIKGLKKEIQQLDLLAGDRDRGLLNDFKRYLISKIGPMLSYHASKFFSVFTAGKYSQMEIDDNYDIYIYDNGEKFGISRFSGGEEDLANLSLRLAISQIISQRSGNIEFNFIVLDEIFGSQDNERRANVLNTLSELSHQFRQVILITHIEEIKDGMQYVIKVFEDGEGIAHVMAE